MYETTLGEEIREDKLAVSIYQQICEILVTIEPDIGFYSFRELMGLLKEEEIELS